MLLLFAGNKQQSSEVKLNKHKVIKSKENLETVLTIHVQKCCVGIWSWHSVTVVSTALGTGAVWPWTAGFCLSNVFISWGVQCKCLFCGLVHSAFCMLFRVRSCQGAEEYKGTQSAGSSGHLWPWKFSVLETVFSCIGLVIIASFPGQSFPIRNSWVLPLCSTLSTHVLAVNPSGREGITKHLLAAPEGWVSPRSGSQSRGPCWESYSMPNERSSWRVLIFACQKALREYDDLGEQRGSSFHEAGPKWVAAILPRGRWLLAQEAFFWSLTTKTLLEQFSARHRECLEQLTRPVALRLSRHSNCGKRGLGMPGQEGLRPGITHQNWAGSCQLLEDSWAFLYLAAWVPLPFSAWVDCEHQASEMQLWILSIHCWALCPSWAQKLYTRLLVLRSKKALSLVCFGAPMLGPAGTTISTSARSMWPLQLVSSPES